MGSLGPGVREVLFEFSKHLWWVWGLILNAISPLLLSCQGFSFALGCGVSFFWWDPVFSCRWLFSHGFDPWVERIPWRRAWQSTLVFLPEESHGQQSLAGYNSWGHEESDTTEVTEYALISKENLHGDFQSGILPNICIL